MFTIGTTVVCAAADQQFPGASLLAKERRPDWRALLSAQSALRVTLMQFDVRVGLASDEVADGVEHSAPKAVDGNAMTFVERLVH